MFDTAVESFRGGRLQDAERALSQLLARSPQHFDALHLLGIIAAQTRRSGWAAELLGRAIQINPSMPVAHRHLANVLVELQRLPEAVASFDAAIRLKPDFVQAYTGRGFAQLQLGQPAAAVQSFDRSIALHPDYPALHGRASALLSLRRYREALQNCDQALRLNPQAADTQVQRAAALRALEQSSEALVSCQRAIALDPGMAGAYVVQGALLSDLAQPQAALESFDAALKLDPRLAKAHNGRGSVLIDLQRPTEALASFDQAIALEPQFANAHNNRGAVLGQLAQFDAARGCFEKAIQLEPDSQDYRLNEAHAHLQQGRFEIGWPRYECRPNQMAQQAALAGRTLKPQWLGEELTGKRVLVHAEQGLGDTLQFCRYIKCLEARGAQVAFAVPPGLNRLLRPLSASVQLMSNAQSPPPSDYECRLLSLPLAFKTTLETIPAEVPYLSAEPERVAYWQQRIGAEGRRIGVCWQGSTTRMDLGRSFPVRVLEPLSKIPGVRLISLQKGAACEQLQSMPPGVVEQIAEPFDDDGNAFVDTAAIMQCLDLVISSDTSIAHLAGALGRPVWIALQHVPDWRWLLNGSSCPWYPSARLVRQQQRGNWSQVIESMRMALLS